MHALKDNMHAYKCSLVHETNVSGAPVVVSDSDWIEEEAYSGTG